MYSVNSNASLLDYWVPNLYNILFSNCKSKFQMPFVDGYSVVVAYVPEGEPTNQLDPDMSFNNNRLGFPFQLGRIRYWII